jgi:hypothetical protein
VNRVTVSAGVNYTLPIKLGVATAAQTVEVTADALTLDSVTDTQTSVLPEVVVQNLPNSGRDFTQLAGQTTGFAGLQTGGGGYNFSVNGSRSNSVNWQIEGTDNNDLWWNIPAVNQTGVNGIAGVIFPIDAIENFSFVTAGSTELGRNPGGTINLTVKAGSNALHGTAFYFNHNELFQATNPFETVKPETRNQHYGFSVGGPILKDKLFFYLAGEHQGFLIGAGGKATEPSAAYQAIAYQVLDYYGVRHNQVAENLLNGTGSLSGLWPASALTRPASSKNYTSTGNDIGHCFNGVLKVDGQLTETLHGRRAPISFASGVSSARRKWMTSTKPANAERSTSMERRDRGRLRQLPARRWLPRIKALPCLARSPRTPTQSTWRTFLPAASTPRRLRSFWAIPSAKSL